jgi:hypothetical protein
MKLYILEGYQLIHLSLMTHLLHRFFLNHFYNDVNVNCSKPQMVFLYMLIYRDIRNHLGP